MTVCFIIKFAGKIFQDVIISVFSINVCTQICYNGSGGAKSLVLISPPHKPCDLFWLCPGIDLLPLKYSIDMQIQTFQSSEKWFITQTTTMLTKQRLDGGHQYGEVIARLLYSNAAITITLSTFKTDCRIQRCSGASCNNCYFLMSNGSKTC